MKRVELDVGLIKQGLKIGIDSKPGHRRIALSLRPIGFDVTGSIWIGHLGDDIFDIAQPDNARDRDELERNKDLKRIYLRWQPPHEDWGGNFGTEEEGWTTKQLATELDVSPRKVASMIERGYFDSSIQEADGHGSKRIFSYEDMVIAKVAIELERIGFGVGAIRDVCGAE